MLNSIIYQSPFPLKVQAPKYTFIQQRLFFGHQWLSCVLWGRIDNCNRTLYLMFKESGRLKGQKKFDSSRRMIRWPRWRKIVVKVRKVWDFKTNHLRERQPKLRLWPASNVKISLAFVWIPFMGTLSGMRIENKQKSWNCFLETKMLRHWIHNSALHPNIIGAFSFLLEFRLISSPQSVHGSNTRKYK